MANHKKKGKDAIRIEQQINEIREKFGKPPLTEHKTYKQRLEEYNKQK